jgi:hypothetical protein
MNGSSDGEFGAVGVVMAAFLPVETEGMDRHLACSMKC